MKYTDGLLKGNPCNECHSSEDVKVLEISSLNIYLCFKCRENLRLLLSEDFNIQSFKGKLPDKGEQPYIESEEIITNRKYNPIYGDDRICECGHSYYRHFDSYEDNYPCGCKYCGCYVFVEAIKNDKEGDI